MHLQGNKFIPVNFGWYAIGSMKDFYWAIDEYTQKPLNIISQFSHVRVSIHSYTPKKGEPSYHISVCGSDDVMMQKHFKNPQDCIRIYNSMSQITIEELYELGFEFE